MISFLNLFVHLMLLKKQYLEANCASYCPLPRKVQLCLYCLCFLTWLTINLSRDRSHEKSGNEQFVTEISKWVFHERGHLKVQCQIQVLNSYPLASLFLMFYFGLSCSHKRNALQLAAFHYPYFAVLNMWIGNLCLYTFIYRLWM